MNYYSAQKADFVLYWTPHVVPTDHLPPPLQKYYTKEIWESRLPALSRKASRYHKRTLELLWTLLFTVAMIAAPIALYFVALNVLPDDKNDNQDFFDDRDHFFEPEWDRGFDKYWKARLIGLAVFCGVVLVFYVPMSLWKRHGTTNVNNMLQKWANEDRAVRPTDNETLPTWKIKSIGILSSKITVIITAPAMPPPSNFHPAAYLPTYLVNAPTNVTTGHYYQQNMAPGQQVGPLPMTSVPLYNSQGEKLPGYAAPVGNVPTYGDEKVADESFENVRV